MNSNQKIYEYLEDKIHKILVILCHKEQQNYEQEVVSKGSCFLINDRNAIMTAKHVIEDAVDSKNHKIFVYIRKIGFVEYTISKVITKSENEYSNIDIDLALLYPKTSINRKAEPIIIRNRPPKTGESVLCVGFSDEILTSSSNISKNLKQDHPEIKEMTDKMKEKIPFINNIQDAMEIFYRPLMKRSMISNVINLKIKNDKIKNTYNGWIAITDNMIHAGASGGPVVDNNGYVIGVISKLLEIKISTNSRCKDTPPSIFIPSGSTEIVSPLLIFSEKEIKEFKINNGPLL